MSDFTEFLLARIAEDEDAARRAAFGYGAVWTTETDDAEDWSVVHADGKRDMVGCEDRDVTQHIARHDPARVLAECEAKRLIVADHGDLNQGWDHDGEFAVPAVCARCEDRGAHDAHSWPCPTLRALALPYVDHPDYREEWRV